MVAEKIRQSIEAHQFDGVDLKMTIGAGVTVVSKADSAHDLIERVNKALYQAKAGGRNQVVFL